MAWAFNKTLWVPDNPPYITAAQLNRIETGVDTAGKLADSSMRKIMDATLVGGNILRFANIPAEYTHLHVKFIGQSNRAGFATTGFRFRINGIATADYFFNYWYHSAAEADNVIKAGYVATNVFGFLGQCPAGNRGLDASVQIGTMDIPYANVATIAHHMLVQSSWRDAATNGAYTVGNFMLTVAAVQQIDLLDDTAGALGPAAKASLYGMV